MAVWPEGILDEGVSMTGKTVNVGIIGCGRISGHHCRSVLAADDCNLVAVCDLLAERAEAYRE